MDAKIVEILDLWHSHFSDVKNQYTEFEDSDVEYFVGCMLYNHFKFSKALKTMKTIDLSYDFLENCGEDEYAKVQSIISSLKFSDEDDKLEFLQNFINFAQERYTDNERYLLDRLKYHVDALEDRMQDDFEPETVVFEKPKPKSKNPLL